MRRAASSGAPARRRGRRRVEHDVQVGVLGLGRRAGGHVRVRAPVAVGGRATQPCPRLHTAAVVLRGVVVLEGSPTVVAPGARQT